MIAPDSPSAPAWAEAANRLPGQDVTVVYTMFRHLGDFVVMGALLKKFDSLGVDFESLIAHQRSPHIGCFEGKTESRFFDVGNASGVIALTRVLRRKRREGRVILGVPMAPGSIQAFVFFWLLKKAGALDYIVDFNLGNADVLTPPRRRYIFDRHLAQAAEIFRQPEWLADFSMPLAVLSGPPVEASPRGRLGLFPWSGRGHLPEFQWPVERWAGLAQTLLESFAVDVVVVGRDAGWARFEQALRAKLSPSVRDRFLARPAGDVPGLVADLRALDGLVTLNTSALHLAHALKLPVVALCGSSGEFWWPEGAHVRLVQDTQGMLPPSDKSYHDPRQPSVARIETQTAVQACLDHFPCLRKTS